MTTLPDGRLFADEVAERPEHWLGASHVKAFGSDTKLLVKLLDAGQRLPIHAHPHADWARKHLGAAHGKAEAWFLLTDGEIHLGLKEDISHDKLLDLIERQDTEVLLEKMHKIKVQAYQTVYVPPGMLHAIGEGILLVEVQEPEDMSILCEWKGFNIDGSKDGHLGLGFPLALQAINTQGLPRSKVLDLITSNDTFGSVLPEDATRYFNLERLQINGSKECRGGFAILVVYQGEMELFVENGKATTLTKGDTLVIPHEDGNFTLAGQGQVILARPPST